MRIHFCFKNILKMHFKNQIIKYFAIALFIFSYSFTIDSHTLLAKTVTATEVQTEQKSEVRTDNQTDQQKKLFLQDIENFKSESLRVLTEKAKLDSAKDNRLAKSLLWTPDLSLVLEQDKTKLTPKTGVTSETNSDFTAVNMNWNLFRGGADWSRWRQAQYLEKAQTNHYLAEQLEIEHQSSIIIFKQIFLRQALRTQDLIYKIKQEALQIIKEKFNQGKVPLEEVKKAELDLSQNLGQVTKAQLAVQENEAEMESYFIHAIQTTLWPLDENIDIKCDTINSTETPADKPMDKLADKAIDKPSWLNEKYWLYQASNEAVQVSYKSYLPSLDLTFQYQESPWQERDNKAWTTSLQLTIPLWSKYETTAALSSAMAQKIEFENEYKMLSQKQKIQRKYLLEKVHQLQKLVAQSKSDLAQTEKLYENILKGFKLGKISMNDLFIEQRRLSDADSLLSQNYYELHVSVIDLCKENGVFLKSGF